MHALRIVGFALLLVIVGSATAEEPKTDKIEAVYKALKLLPGKFEDSKGPFSPGDVVKINFALMNQTSRPIVPPLYKLSNREVPAIGIEQAWIERLGKVTEIPVLGNRPARQGAKYAGGGTIIITPEKIDGLKEIPLTWGPIGNIDTKDFPPGKYKYTIEYKELYDGKNGGKVLQTQSVEFEIKTGPKGK